LWHAELELNGALEDAAVDALAATLPCLGALTLSMAGGAHSQLVERWAAAGSAALPHLRSLRLLYPFGSDGDARAVAKLASAAPGLEELAVRGGSGDEDDVAALAAVLPRVPRLRVLELHGAFRLLQRPHASATALCAGLAGLPELRTLSLSSLPLAGAPAKALGTALAECPQLTSLDLDGCAMAPLDVLSLAAGLVSAGCPLRDLHLSNNRWDGSVASVLAALLADKAATLAHFHLDGCGLDRESAVVLLRSVRLGSALRTLRLQHQDIRPSVHIAEPLAAALARHPWLNVRVGLALSGDRGALACIAHLRHVGLASDWRTELWAAAHTAAANQTSSGDSVGSTGGNVLAVALGVWLREWAWARRRHAVTAV
jgi:Ran GTPase-activating protein (RanGAP) involved in mRNA processing and transport